MLGGIGGRRRRGWQRMRWLDGITDWWTWFCVYSVSWWYRETWHVAIHGVAKSRTWLNSTDWGTRDQIANISWIIEKLRKFRKISTSASLTMKKPLMAWITMSCGKFLKSCKYQTTWPASWEICMQLREGNGTPLQYSHLENPMDGGAWWAKVHGVTKSWTRLSDFTCK